jgi:hypothetical protein
MTIRHTNDKNYSKLSFQEILESASSLGLLSKIKAKQSRSHNSQIIERFEAINLFIDKNRREPIINSTNFDERLLANRLIGFKNNNPTKELIMIDRHGILNKLSKPLSNNNKPLKPLKEVTSLKDIFKSDRLGVLKQNSLDIFNLKNIPKIEKEMPDEIAQRIVCEDFYNFESLFQNAHKKIKSQSVEVIPFKQGSQINKSDIFVLRGMLCLVDEISEFKGKADEPYNPRLRVIFENKTESNLLLRSLAAALYKDENSRRLLATSDDIVAAFNNISHKDKRTGVVYIVASLSNNQAIKSIPNLYKIGYTELTVEERTRNAENDTAFLEAPIRIIASIECFNLNPNKFETLIHAFLSSQRLLIDLYSKDGKRYKPQEWFSVPLDTARETIKRIIDGTIINYRIDNTTGKIILKHSA